MSAQHTPGPWRYLEDHDGDNAGRPLTVCDAANNDLANVYSQDDATVDISRGEAIANARLIAAAPDGLALAKGLAHTIKHWQDDIAANLKPTPESLAVAAERIRLFIAKATGAA